MSTFILAFALFLLMVPVMAIGYILQRITIAGSCVGLGALGIYKHCECPDPCDIKQARMEREEKSEIKIKTLQDNHVA